MRNATKEISFEILHVRCALELAEEDPDVFEPKDEVPVPDVIEEAEDAEDVNERLLLVPEDVEVLVPEDDASPVDVAAAV